MLTSKRRTGAYYNWSVGIVTTSPKDGSRRVEYHTISLFHILRYRVPVSFLWRFLRQHSNGQVKSIVGGARETSILIVDYGAWCKTSCTASHEPPLHLMPVMYTPTGIFSLLPTPTRCNRKSGHGAYLRELKDKASAWYWGLVISRWVIDNPNACAQSSASRIATLEKLRQNG